MSAARAAVARRLSSEGERVLRLYQKLQALQAQVLEAAEDASDLDLLGRLMLSTSARNQLHGKVVAIEAQGHNDLIRLELAEGLIIDAQITHDSTLRLELEIGTEVVALIKAGWLELLAIEHAATPGHNCLTGTIEEDSRRRRRPQRSAHRPAQRPDTVRTGRAAAPAKHCGLLTCRQTGARCNSAPSNVSARHAAVSAELQHKRH